MHGTTSLKFIGQNVLQSASAAGYSISHSYSHIFFLIAFLDEAFFLKYNNYAMPKLL